MLQVKLFTGSASGMEKEMNEWLKNNPKIEVIQILQSYGTGVLITILYKNL